MLMERIHPVYVGRCFHSKTRRLISRELSPHTIARLLSRPRFLTLQKSFVEKLNGLRKALAQNPLSRVQAATILRTLINGIVLYPRKKRGTMSIEVQGEPSALFLPANDEALEERNWMITVVAEEGLEPPTRGL